MLTIVSLSFGNFAKAKEFYKMSTLGPGSTPYVVMSTFAKIIGTHVPNVEIQVNATGAATRHAVDAARGKIHFFMGAPSVHSFIVATDSDSKFRRGDVLRPATWKAPAKNKARGNIFDGDFPMQWTGPLYL